MSMVIADSAIRQPRSVAGDKFVAVASPTIAQQCLDAGLLDAIHVSPVPVLLGAGVRLFDDLPGTSIELDDRPRVTPGVGVTHVQYQVRRAAR